ncbi:MAG: endonuclease [Gammaproteobacteria bacterium]|nr:endonuclease [Gammaproteobacteria bacterium]MDE0513272.1 endonuclease [Gammaproteobacteria bacterium]
MNHCDKLIALYERLYNAYGPQHWWPAESPFEVIVGAVLTQNTSWKNVEKAITRLQATGNLDLDRIAALAQDELAELIRSSGFFNVKAKRLKNLCGWLKSQGGLDALTKWDTGRLRQSLLSINGIGPETADDILLYAFQRPVFVIDTYTRRLLKKLGLVEGAEDYEILRQMFEACLPRDHRFYNEYHALIVRHAKEKCARDNQCRHCAVEAPI